MHVLGCAILRFVFGWPFYCMQTTASVEVHQEERTGEQGKRMNMFSSLRNQKVRIWACTLKFPSLCHGHSVKGPGLVAMATLPSLWSLCLTSPHVLTSPSFTQ